MAYEIFTQKYDEVRHVTAELNKSNSIEAIMVDRRISYLEKLGKSQDVNTSSLEFKSVGPAPVFLLDCSGSMRGQKIQSAVFALLSLGDALHAAGRPFEIAGYTTVNWKGGQSRNDWIEQGRKGNPGRLNDLLNIVVKGMDEPWEEARKNMSYLLKKGLLKENIDGEAYDWALSRIQEFNEDIVFIPISDGSPFDASTLSVNDPKILDDHLQEQEVRVIRSGVATQLIVIGDEGKPETILPDAIHVYPEKGLQSFFDGFADACHRAFEMQIEPINRGGEDLKYTSEL